MRFIAKAILVAVVSSGLSAAPGHAGEAETALLRTYIGGWSGSGVLRGGDQPEAFNCRLMVTQGRLIKINYAGRCSLVNMNLSVSGTISFNDEANRYEATMRSNVGLSAAAVGSKQGSSITFKLSEKQSDRVGTPVKIDSVLQLSGKQIVVDFTVELNRSGQTLTTTVPFSRQ
ncbi:MULTISPECIES: hypothetical protein [unclassified Devosia]|uniref:hypothetical protein n=1 Tax=unclassified Devosia TaxID=196773 RepID=UPI00086A95A4|nr:MULTISPECIES: hypothetical protein [unclassified Devosia]MBN9362438.1 hypothetical protein [Devosia sp.]ODS86837.1 MAG: hypothetical protein ABS47_13400 [Devosia sp. SCN 66-27]OJX24331.1 MAG: hypothetical protein BGO83_06780 [Devosia sp. 66-14]